MRIPRLRKTKRLVLDVPSNTVYTNEPHTQGLPQSPCAIPEHFKDTGFEVTELMSLV